jgi:hypothetical protein
MGRAGSVARNPGEEPGLEERELREKWGRGRTRRRRLVHRKEEKGGVLSCLLEKSSFHSMHLD